MACGSRAGYAAGVIGSTVLALLHGLHLAPETAQADERPPLLPVAEMFRAAELPTPRISPTGRFISYFDGSGPGHRTLVVATANRPGEPLYRIEDTKTCVVSHRWAQTDGALLVVLRPACAFHGLAPVKGFQVAAVDRVSGAATALTPPMPFRPTLHLAAGRPDHVLVTRDKRDPLATQALGVDTRNGETEIVPIPAKAFQVAVNRNLEPMLALARTTDGGMRLNVRTGAGDWIDAGRYAIEERYGFKVLQVLETGAAAILIDTMGRDKAAVVRLDFETGSREVLYQNPDHEVADAIFDTTGEELLAVRLSGAKYRWVGVDDKFGSHLDRLRQRLNGELSVDLCCGPDGVWLVTSSSDVSPPKHHLYRPSDHALALLPGRSPALSPSQFQSTEPVSFEARDGLKLHGYFTPGLVASNLDGSKPPPLVVVVHGGPALKDAWAFDPERQWLASRGYSVLQVNFRGSVGQGAKLVQAGFGEWGRRMQDDIADATDWVVQTGRARSDRIAIMGHSYGGYAALMGIARDASPYACGVAMSAPSDLDAFLRDLEKYRALAQTETQASFVESQLARYRVELTGSVREIEDRSQFDDRSPLQMSDRIEKPLLLVHGGRDRGVRLSHAKRMFEKLSAREHTAALLTLPWMGHKAVRPKSKRIIAQVIERFLARCLGGRRSTVEFQAEQDGYRLEVSGQPFLIEIQGAD